MDRRIKAAIEIMHSNAHCRLELPELAQQVNLSPSRFSHLFKTETSLSPKQYSYQWRVQKAKELLDRTFLKVNEISALLGYKHTGDLSRAFTKFYGYPPSLSRSGVVIDASAHCTRKAQTKWKVPEGRQMS